PISNRVDQRYEPCSRSLCSWLTQPGRLRRNHTAILIYRDSGSERGRNRRHPSLRYGACQWLLSSSEEKRGQAAPKIFRRLHGESKTSHRKANKQELSLRSLRIDAHHPEQLRIANAATDGSSLLLIIVHRHIPSSYPFIPLLEHESQKLLGPIFVDVLWGKMPFGKR